MKRLGFFGKQLVIYSVLIMAAVVTLIFWAHSYVIDISREKAAITQEQLTTATLGQVDAYLDQLRLIATQVSHDSEIVNTMERLYTEENPVSENYFEADASLVQILDMHNDLQNPIYCIEVYNAYGDYLCTDYTSELLRAGVEYSNSEGMQIFLHSAFVRDQRDVITMGPYLKEGYADPVHQNCVFMIMPIRNREKTKIYGYAAVYRSIDELEQQLDMDKRTGIDVFLYSERNQGRGRQLYPRDQDFPDSSSGNFYETEVQSKHDWFVVLLQDHDTFLSSYHNMLLYLILGGAALFVLLFICVYLLVHHTSKPILALSSRVKEASLTNYPDLSVPDDAMDEVKELERAVDHMMQRVKASVELEQQAYLKALQAQMNPHFLYNCLSTISSLGTEAESPSIPRFCTHLAAILRYETTYKNGLVTLTEELDNIRDYLELMQIRYEDDMSYEITAEPGLESLSLPRLVLQPLVENCFTHGFKTVEPPWRLSVRAFRENHRWVIQVSDNGAGFGEEARTRLGAQIDDLMAQLRGGTPELEIGGLGLANTVVRLRLMSADPVDFSIMPNEPTGTIITLRGEYHD